MFSPTLIYRRRRMGGSDPFAAYAANGINPALILDFENEVYLLDGGEIAYSDLVETGSPALDSDAGAQRLRLTLGTDKITIPAAKLPTGTEFSFVLSGNITYADTGIEQTQPYRWFINTTNYIRTLIETAGPTTGTVTFAQRETTSGLDSVISNVSALSPGTNVAFSFGSRHGPTFVNGAVDEDVRTEDTTPTALPDLSSTDFEIGFHNAGTITLRVQRFAMWNVDIGDAGLGEATAPFDLNAANAVYTFENDRVSTFDGDLVYVAG